MSSDSRVRNRISPIQMKSGSAVSVHDDDAPQIVTAIASPAGRDEKSCMPIHATPASARPIHTPLPRSSEQRDDQQRGDRAGRSSATRCAAASSLRARRLAHAPPRISSTSSSTNAISSTTVPTAIAICGIHSGVASLPVRDVVERPRLVRQPHAVEGEQRAPAASPAASDQISSRRRARAVQLLQDQRDADVLAALQRMRQRQEARAPPCSSRHTCRCRGSASPR